MEVIEYKELKAKIFKEVKLDILVKVAEDRVTYKDKMQNTYERFHYSTPKSVYKHESLVEMDLARNITTLRKDLKAMKSEFDSYGVEKEKIRYSK